MVSTIRTRFCCGSPLTDFMEHTILFGTFQRHDLNELIERKVRYLASPEPFHTVNIQGFKAQSIIFPAQTCRKFPVPIKTLPCYLPILSAKGTQCFEPPVRLERLATQGFTQRPQFIISTFEVLRTFYLSTIGEGEVCFQSKVNTNALTCFGHWIGIVNIITTEAHPIVTASSRLIVTVLIVSYISRCLWKVNHVSMQPILIRLPSSLYPA